MVDVEGMEVAVRHRVVADQGEELLSNSKHSHSLTITAILLLEVAVVVLDQEWERGKPLHLQVRCNKQLYSRVDIPVFHHLNKDKHVRFQLQHTELLRWDTILVMLEDQELPHNMDLAQILVNGLDNLHTFPVPVLVNFPQIEVVFSIQELGHLI